MCIVITTNNPIIGLCYTKLSCSRCTRQSHSEGFISVKSFCCKNIVAVLLIFIILSETVMCSAALQHRPSHRNYPPSGQRSKRSDNFLSRKSLSPNNECSKGMSGCSQLYTDLSATEEDCKLFRTYLGCLLGLEQHRKICRGFLMYHSAVTSTENMIKKKCKTDNGLLPIIPPPATESGVNPGGGGTRPNVAPSCLHPLSSNPEYLVCAIYGDPHLRAFSGAHETCSLEGAWPLLDNRFFTLQVSTRPALPGQTATVVDQVSVIIKDDGRCLSGSSYRSFTASSQHTLPRALDWGPFGGAVTLLEHAPDTRELILGHVSTRLLIRRTGRALSLVLRVPNEIATQRTHSQRLVGELCRVGCPANMQLPHDWAFDQGPRRMPLREAEALCGERGLVDRFFDACVFDLLVTADSSFAEMAVLVQTDVLTMTSGLLLSNRTRYRPYAPPWHRPNSATTRINTQDLAFFSILIVVTWHRFLTVLHVS